MRELSGVIANPVPHPSVEVGGCPQERMVSDAVSMTSICLQGGDVAWFGGVGDDGADGWAVFLFPAKGAHCDEFRRGMAIHFHAVFLDAVDVHLCDRPVTCGDVFFFGCHTGISFFWLLGAVIRGEWVGCQRRLKK